MYFILTHRRQGLLLIFLQRIILPVLDGDMVLGHHFITSRTETDIRNVFDYPDSDLELFRIVTN